MVKGCITILSTASALPTALGTANGLAQNTASVFRILGPAATTSLLALSIEKKLAGETCSYALRQRWDLQLITMLLTGYFLVYYVACMIAIIGWKMAGMVAVEKRKRPRKRRYRIVGNMCVGIVLLFLELPFENR